MYIVFFFLLHFGKLESCSTYFFLYILNLIIKFLVLLSYRLDCTFKSFNSQARIPIVLQNILFLKFEGSSLLVSSPFLIGELSVLLFKQVICMRAFAKLLIDESVLSCQSLDIFCKLCYLLGLELCQLCLLF